MGAAAAAAGPGRPRLHPAYLFDRHGAEGGVHPQRRLEPLAEGGFQAGRVELAGSKLVPQLLGRQADNDTQGRVLLGRGFTPLLLRRRRRLLQLLAQ